MSWNEADPAGVTGAALSIDGNPTSKSPIYGPYADSSGVTYAGVFGEALTAGGTYTYAITATDKLGNTSTLSGSFTVPVAAGPVIGQVAFNFAAGFMSWNEAGPLGVSGAALSIDGNPTSNCPIYGPYAAPSGVTYAGGFGETMVPGSTHTYTITATDKLGNTSTLSGSFTALPAVNQVAFNFGAGFMSWNEADPAGVTGAALSIDGNPTSNCPIYGPYAGSAGVTYAGGFGETMAAGSTHTYTITATDKLGQSSALSGSFTVPAAAGPAISQVAFNFGAGFMSWNEADPAGVTGAALSIDGNPTSNCPIYGPYAGSAGVTYAGGFGETLAAGAHTFVITATENGGIQSQYTGTMFVGPVISQVAVSTTPGVDGISWNVTDPGMTLTTSELTVDGSLNHNMLGPIAAPNGGSNYTAYFGDFPISGSHSYVITVIDSAGNSATYDGSFTVG